MYTPMGTDAIQIFYYRGPVLRHQCFHETGPQRADHTVGLLCYHSQFMENNLTLGISEECSKHTHTHQFTKKQEVKGTGMGDRAKGWVFFFSLY